MNKTIGITLITLIVIGTVSGLGYHFVNKRKMLSTAIISNPVENNRNDNDKISITNWKDFSNDNYFYIKFKYDPMWRITSYGGGAEDTTGTTLDEAVDHYTDQSNHIQYFGSQTSIYDFSYNDIHGKILLPDHPFTQGYIYNHEGTAFKGTFIVQLPTPLVDILKNPETRFLSFEFSIPLLPNSDQSSISDQQKDLAIFKTIMSTLQFQKPPSREEQLKNLHLCKDTQKNGTLPKFEDFPVTEIFKGTPAPLDMSSEIARSFKTRLSEGLKNPPTIAGHYGIVEWGCGSECPVAALVDIETGKAYGTWENIVGRIDSSLFIDDIWRIYDPEYDSGLRRYYTITKQGPQFLCSELVELKTLQ